MLQRHCLSSVETVNGAALGLSYILCDINVNSTCQINYVSTNISYSLACRGVGIVFVDLDFGIISWFGAWAGVGDEVFNGGDGWR